MLNEKTIEEILKRSQFSKNWKWEPFKPYRKIIRRSPHLRDTYAMVSLRNWVEIHGRSQELLTADLSSFTEASNDAALPNIKLDRLTPTQKDRMAIL